MNGPSSLRSNFPGIIAGVLLAFFLAYAAAVAMPLLSEELTEVSSQTSPRGDRAFSGKGIYDREGCWYCHTQSVRPVGVDLGLGKVTMPDRLARDVPPSVGLVRIGPDLSCLGDRYESPDELKSRVSNPREVRPTSTMPSFAYLSPEELDDLGAYLSSLTCE